MSSPAPRPRALLVAFPDISSRAISWWGGGGWSHLANMLVDGSFIDARADWVKDAKGTYYKGADGKPIEPGVRRRPGDYLKAAQRWILIELGEERHYAPWVRVLESQIGKPYDFVGIWDFVTGSNQDRNWRDERAWFCDELGVWSWEKVGICPQVPEPVYRINPGAALLLGIGTGARVVASGGA